MPLTKHHAYIVNMFTDQLVTFFSSNQHGYICRNTINRYNVDRYEDYDLGTPLNNVEVFVLSERGLKLYANYNVSSIFIPISHCKNSYESDHLHVFT